MRQSLRIESLEIRQARDRWSGLLKNCHWGGFLMVIAVIFRKKVHIKARIGAIKFKDRL